MKRKKSTNKKFVNQKHTPKEVDLTYMTLLESGYKIQEVASRFGVSKQYVSKRIQRLKACGALSRIGYGVWKVDRKLYYAHVKKVNLLHRCRYRDTPPVRGHGFRFFVPLTGCDFENLISQVGLDFKDIPGGVSFELLGHRVKLFFKGSLDVYFKSGWSAFGSDAHVTYRAALDELGKILVRFESLFKIDLPRPFKFSLGRQHYALVKNELAKEYNNNKEKLRIQAEDGRTWLLIDNSFAMAELETQHRHTGRVDSDRVKFFFNELRSEGYSFSGVYRDMKGLADLVNRLSTDLEPLIKAFKPSKGKEKRPDYFG